MDIPLNCLLCTCCPVLDLFLSILLTLIVSSTLLHVYTVNLVASSSRSCSLYKLNKFFLQQTSHYCFSLGQLHGSSRFSLTHLRSAVFVRSVRKLNIKEIRAVKFQNQHVQTLLAEVHLKK